MLSASLLIREVRCQIGWVGSSFCDKPLFSWVGLCFRCLDFWFLQFVSVCFCSSLPPFTIVPATRAALLLIPTRSTRSPLLKSQSVFCSVLVLRAVSRLFILTSLLPTLFTYPHWMWVCVCVCEWAGELFHSQVCSCIEGFGELQIVMIDRNIQSRCFSFHIGRSFSL